MPLDRANALLRSFARQQGMTLQFIQVNSFSELFPMLQAGQGDLISANLAQTAWRQKNFLLSIPFFHTREIVFTAEKSPLKGDGPAVLYGVNGKILPGTTYEENFKKLSLRDPRITWRPLPRTITHEELMDAVENGQYAYSALNECDLDARLSYRPGLRKLFPLQNNVPLVFAARKNAQKLIRDLNCFLAETAQFNEEVPEPVPDTAPPAPVPVQPTVPAQKKMQLPPPAKAAIPPPPASAKPVLPHAQPAVRSIQFHGDLERIKKRGYIRMLTSNDVFSCYLHQGRMQGFEYDLAKKLAKELNVALITVIPPNFHDLIPYLEAGKGDFIAAHVTRTQNRIRSYPHLSFCAPYLGVTQVLVGRSGEKISGIRDLRGRKIYIRRGTSFYDTLKKMQAAGGKFNIVLLTEEESELQTLRNVASGRYDLTVVDDIVLNFAASAGCKVKSLMKLSPQEPFCWIVNKNAPHLAAAINRFFKKENKSAFFNISVKRYFSVHHARKVAPWIFRNRKLVLSPYDDLFRKYGREYRFSWYFLAAQAYQESGFKADTVNSIGATGLMQMLPGTAREMGISNLKNPANGIRAGAKYLAKMRARFPANMTTADQLCFSLASYNAGYGHVQDARKLAAQKGWNPNIWFQNTERALALLEDSRYASRAKYGCCRASETIPYVRNIMLQSYHYRKLMESQLKKKENNSRKESTK